MFIYMGIERPVFSSLNLEAILAVRFPVPQMYFITSWTREFLLFPPLYLDNWHSNIISYSLTASQLSIYFAFRQWMNQLIKHFLREAVIQVDENVPIIY